jgi:hypothetical protein
LVRVETLHGLHQADVAFLDQVGVRQAVAEVAARNRHHQAQVREHEFLRGVEIVRIPQPLRQRDFFLVGQHRQAVHRGNIRVDVTEIAGEAESQGTIAGWNQCGLCGHHIFLVE